MTINICASLVLRFTRRLGNQLRSQHWIGPKHRGEVNDRILDEVGEEPGNLPLLEFTLTRLWQGRHRGALTHEAYESEQVGGLKKAIARRADEVIKGMSAEEVSAARRVLVQLVRPGEGRVDSRARLVLSESLGPAGPVVDKLVKARLLVTGRDDASGKETLEVAHEALIRNWDRLGRWVDEDRGFLRSVERIRAKMKHWQEKGAPDSDLLLGSGLEIAAGREILARHDALVDEIRACIERSIATEEARISAEQNRLRQQAEEKAALEAARLRAEAQAAEQKAAKQQAEAKAARQSEAARRSDAAAAEGRAEAARRMSKRMRIGTVVISILAVIALGFGWSAMDRARDAEQQRAEVQHQAQKAIEEKEIADSRLRQAQINQSRFLSSLARQATTSGDAVTGMLLALAAPPTKTERPYLVEVEGALYQAAEETRELAVLTGDDGMVYSGTFCPDGRRVVTASDDKTARLWDAQSGKLLAVLAGHEGPVISATFSPDGRRVVTASFDNTARLWDAQSDKQLAVLAGHEDTVTSAAFSPDGRRVVMASADGTAQVWRVFPTTQVLIDYARSILPRQLTSAQRHQYFLEEGSTP